MLRKEYAIFEFLDKGSALFQSVMLFGFELRAKEFYPKMSYHPEEAKTYLFTDKTMARLSTMDFTGLKPEDVMLIAEHSKTDKGFVLSTGTYRKLHLGYTITPNQITIPVFKGQIHSVDSTEGFNTKMVGTIIIDHQGITLSPVNRLSVFAQMGRYSQEITADQMANFLKNFAKDDILESYKLMNRILKLEEQGKEAIIGNRLSFNHIVNSPVLREDNVIGPMIDDYYAKAAQLETALRMFLFLKCADITQKLIVDENDGPRLTYNRKVQRMRYTIVDSTWDEEITVDNPFIVRGHLRNQPYKDGPRLIYIDAYLKKGYHRRSGKQINEEQP